MSQPSTIYIVENQGTFLGFIIKVAIAGFILKLVLFG